MNRKSYHEEQTALARRAYEKHEVYSHREPFTWELRKPLDSCIYRVEIICSPIGTLIVHGDIDPALFGHHPPMRGDTQSEEKYRAYAGSMLNWMSHRNGACSYVHEKARIGSGHDFYTDDDDVAIDDLRDHMQGYDKDAKITRALQHAIEEIEGGGDLVELRQELVTDLHEYDAWEWAGSIGRVVCPQLYLAQASIARLYRLLFGGGEA